MRWNSIRSLRVAYPAAIASATRRCILIAASDAERSRVLASNAVAYGLSQSSVAIAAADISTTIGTLPIAWEPVTSSTIRMILRRDVSNARRTRCRRAGVSLGLGIGRWCGDNVSDCTVIAGAESGLTTSGPGTPAWLEGEVLMGALSTGQRTTGRRCRAKRRRDEAPRLAAGAPPCSS